MYLPKREEKKKQAEKTSFVMIAITLPHTFHNGTYLIALSLHEKANSSTDASTVCLLKI